VDIGIQKFLEDSKAVDILEAEDPQAALATWSLDLSQVAKELTLTSHPTKYSHSSIQKDATLLLVEAEAAADGFVRSGNVPVKWDMQGNSARLKVFKFLSVKLADGKTILSHFQKRSKVLQTELGLNEADFDALAHDFLAVEKESVEPITHGRIKQVYFPVGDDYHLLSLLTASGILHRLVESLKEHRFSDTAKSVREARKLNQPHEKPLHEFYNLTLMGFGGTKPQNVSGLNMQMGGRVPLLPSLPPVLKKGFVRIPHHDFFQNQLYWKAFTYEFDLLAKVLQRQQNNQSIRQHRDHIVERIWQRMIEKSWVLRNQPAGWSLRANCGIPRTQKIWLDAETWPELREDEDWQEAIIDFFLRWLKDQFNRHMDAVNQGIRLADSDLRHYKHDLLMPSKEDLL
jgi:CRISPR-associated protein Csy1